MCQENAGADEYEDCSNDVGNHVAIQARKVMRNSRTLCADGGPARFLTPNINVRSQAKPATPEAGCTGQPLWGHGVAINRPAIFVPAIEVLRYWR